MKNAELDHSQFVIGSLTADGNRIATVRMRRRTGLVHGTLHNTGAAAFTFSVRESNDNGVGDAWATQQIDVAGTLVNSVVVQPGGVVEFIIRVGSPVRSYLEFNSSDQSGAAGVLTIYHAQGNLSEVGQSGIAYPA